MAVTLIAAVSSAVSYAITTTAFSWATAFAIAAAGAGLSLVSRALMPKPDLGAQMAGQSVMTREAAHSRKIIYGRARIGGNVVYLESTGDDNKYLWLVIAVAGHEIDAYEQVWFNDKKIWDGGSYVGNWGSYVSISFKDGSQTTADSGLVAASTKWTSNHKLLDTAYMVVKLTYDQEQFAQGLPNISTVVRGKKVWHPSHSSPVWSQNPALCVRDYLTNTKYGLGESSSNIASINTALGVCDEAVDLAAGGTQPRYTLDGVIDTGNSIKANIENMVGSMIGRLVYSGGKFEIHAGEYVAPAVTIDESMMIGEISVQTKQSRRSAYNGVKGVFLSEEDNYILADYPAQISSTYATQDGDPIYLDMPLPYTVNNVRAQRIAQLALRRSRQQESITIPCNLNALKFKVGDNISVTNTRLGYSAKVFEVVGYSMGFSSDQMVVNVDAIETASSIWSWDEDEQVFLGAGEVDIYDGTSTTAPASITVTADTFISSDGTSSASFDVSWPNSVDAFVDHYVVEWKVSTDSSYFSQSTKTSPLQIVGLDPSKTYDVRVKAVNGLAVSSSYVSAQAVPATDTTAPNAPTSVNAKNEFEQITISWVNPTAKDFETVFIYGSNSGTSGFTKIGESRGTTFTEPELGTGVTRYYKLKALDKTGNASNYSSVDSATTTQVPVGGIANDAVDTDQIADDAVDTGQIADEAVEINQIAATLQSTNYSSGSSGWKIQKSGAVEFEEATIRGEITASTGVIGGFTVGSDSLIAGANATRVSLSTANGIHLGHNTFASAPFRVDRAGALTATSATITGALTLTNVDGTTVEYSGGNLQVGTVQTANIANDAITNAQIAVDAIQGDVIAAGAIVTTMLGVDAVTSAKIADNAVLTAAIAADAVTTVNIANDAITTALIADNAVTSAVIAAGAITSTELGVDAVTSAKIADNAVTAAQIGADAVTTAKIADDAVTNALIATDAVNGDSIAANSVTASSIVAGTITASELAADSVTASQIAAGSVTASEIAANTITASQIAADAITANEIAADAVTANAIAANTITAAEIAANTVTASQIAADAITADEIAANAVTASAIAANTITASEIAADAIGANEIAANAITSDAIAANAITANEIAANAVTANAIQANAVTANEIAANAITASEIAADAVTANEIAANAVTADAIAANSVTASEIAANTITASQIAAGAVTANEMTVANLAAISADMGTITAGSISVGLLTGDVTEVYPLMLYLNTLLTTTDTVIASWSLPAPSLSLSKRQKLSFNAKFVLENTNNSTPSTNYISFDIEKKSKGVNAQDIGTVTLVSFSNYQGLIYVSGNKLGIVDGVGGIGDSASPSSSSNVLGVYYDSATNRTYINYGAFNNPFSTGDTCYYSDSKFTSAGTWVTPSDGFNYAVKVPEGTGSTINVNIPIELFFGTTNTATDFRIQAEMLANIVSGHKFTVSHVRGTMENIA